MISFDLDSIGILDFDLLNMARKAGLRVAGIGKSGVLSLQANHSTEFDKIFPCIIEFSFEENQWLIFKDER